MAEDPFISVTDLGDYLGRNLTADNGAIMAVDAASQVCRTIAEQTFNRGTTTEFYDGSGTDALLLRELPVNSVGSVSVSDAATPPTWTTAGTADFALNGNGVLFATNTGGTAIFGTVWPQGRQNIRVTYDHGYTEVPTDVRRVALEVAARTIIQGPAKSEAMGDVNVTYAAASTELTPTERWILRKYRRAR